MYRLRTGETGNNRLGKCDKAILFRAIRPEEYPAVITTGLLPPPGHDKNKTINQHVTAGSKSKVKSRYISCSTSEGSSAAWAYNASKLYVKFMAHMDYQFDKDDVLIRDEVVPLNKYSVKCVVPGVLAQNAAKSSNEIVIKDWVKPDAILEVFYVELGKEGTPEKGKKRMNILGVEKEYEYHAVYGEGKKKDKLGVRRFDAFSIYRRHPDSFAAKKGFYDLDKYDRKDPEYTGLKNPYTITPVCVDDSGTPENVPEQNSPVENNPPPQTYENSTKPQKSTEKPRRSAAKTTKPRRSAAKPTKPRKSAAKTTKPRKSAAKTRKSAAKTRKSAAKTRKSAKRTVAKPRRLVKRSTRKTRRSLL
jgi:hypothetical protein